MIKNMLITELRLLEIDLYDGEKLVYSGKTEDLPEELKLKHISITGNEGKKLILKLED